MHRRLGIATLSQLAFPSEGNSIFLWEKSYWDDAVVLKQKDTETSRAHGALQAVCNNIDHRVSVKVSSPAINTGGEDNYVVRKKRA